MRVFPFRRSTGDWLTTAMRRKHHDSRAGWLAGRRDCRLADGRCARLIQSTNNKLTCGAGRGAGRKSFVGFLYFIPLLLYTLWLDSRLFPNATTVDILRPAPNSLSVVHHHPPIVHTFLFIYIHIYMYNVYSRRAILSLTLFSRHRSPGRERHVNQYTILPTPLSLRRLSIFIIVIITILFLFFFSPSSRTVNIPSRNTFSRIRFVRH